MILIDLLIYDDEVNLLVCHGKPCFCMFCRSRFRTMLSWSLSLFVSSLPSTSSLSSPRPRTKPLWRSVRVLPRSITSLRVWKKRWRMFWTSSPKRLMHWAWMLKLLMLNIQTGIMKIIVWCNPRAISNPASPNDSKVHKTYIIWQSNCMFSNTGLVI